MTGRLKYWFIAAALGTLPLIALAFLSRPVTAASLWYVATGGSDANDCQTAVTACATINAAIGKAAPGDTINVATGTYTANSGPEVVLITHSVTLLGGWDSGFASQGGLSTVDGQTLRRGMTVTGTLTAAVNRFVFENGRSSNSGGGISNASNLTLSRSQVISNSTDNIVAFGGGVFNSGFMTVTESTISANTVLWQGGGLYNTAGRLTVVSSTVSNNNTTSLGNGGGGGAGIEGQFGELVLENSTVSGNTLAQGYEGAGIWSYGTLTVSNSTISSNHGGNGEGIQSYQGAALFNTTISGNSGIGLSGSGTIVDSVLAGNGSSDCVGMTSLGHNLIQNNNGCSLAGTDTTGVSARLATLQDNGGPAPTQALLPGSPAINGGDPGGCFGPAGLLATDERGFARNGRCDIGAYEAQALDASDKTVSPHSALPGQPVRFTVSVANAGTSPMTGIAVTDTLPAELTYVNGSLTATGGIYNYSAGVITWTGSVNAGESVAIQFDAASLANTSLGTVITNTAVIKHNGENVIRQASLTIAQAKLYLPILFRPLPGIQGYVTVNGAPAAGVFLDLRRFDGQSFSTQLSTQTDGNGFYNFTTAPSLPPGQFYYVRYLNTGGITTELSLWGTAEIKSFTSGDSVAAGNFDLADVSLVSPNPGATVALPSPFQWTRRAATPSDSYQFSLFDPHGTAFGQTALLGYVNGLTLTGVPSSFHSGTPYGWYVAINSPDGGYGESYYYRRITFSNILAGSQPAVAGGAVVAAAKAPVDRPRP